MLNFILGIFLGLGLSALADIYAIRRLTKEGSELADEIDAKIKKLQGKVRQAEILEIPSEEQEEMERTFEEKDARGEDIHFNQPTL